VFPPDHAIAWIPRCNQRLPPEKGKKGQFSPFLVEDCRHNTGIVLYFKSHPRVRSSHQYMVTTVTSISSLVTKHCGLVAKTDHISLCWQSITVLCHILCPFNIRKEVNPSFYFAVVILSHWKTFKWLTLVPWCIFSSSSFQFLAIFQKKKNWAPKKDIWKVAFTILNSWLSAHSSFVHVISLKWWWITSQTQ